MVQQERRAAAKATLHEGRENRWRATKFRGAANRVAMVEKGGQEEAKASGRRGGPRRGTYRSSGEATERVQVRLRCFLGQRAVFCFCPFLINY